MGTTLDKMFKLLLLVFWALSLESVAQEVKVGAGSYSTVAKGHPSQNVYKTANIKGALPTNKWWTPLLWGQKYSNEMFPYPLCMKAVEGGLSIGYPNIEIRGNGIFGSYINDMTVGSSGAATFEDTKLDDYSDWTITMMWENNNANIWATTSQGSPFVFFKLANGHAVITFPSIPEVWSGGGKSNIIGVTSNGHHYGIFGEPGTLWSGVGTITLNNTGGSFITVALLPDNKVETLTFFEEYAYNRVKTSKVAWKYDEQTSKLTTTYTIETDPPGQSTIFGLLPHQWKYLTSFNFLKFEYLIIKGKMRTVAGTSFSTVHTYNGILPMLPLLQKRRSNSTEEFNSQTLKGFIEDVRIESDNHFSIGRRDMYFAGKAFQRISTLVPIAKQVGNVNAATEFIEWLKVEISNYFVATGKNGSHKADFYFYYDNFFGTLIGYPSFVNSDTLLNNHHFHYGYWIKASAEVAFHDKDWVKNWGPFVELLIRDAANWDRSDTKFPFLRCFDVYQGHSWASGLGADEGSSGEAANAWSALILWGEATSNKIIRDLGVYLYTTEVAAIQQYVFNVDQDIFPKNFSFNTIAMIMGSQLEYRSWVGGTPEYIRGTNFLPVSPSSTYLGYYPGYVMFHLNQMKQENGKSDVWTIWRELFWQYQSLADPDGAIKLFHNNNNINYSPEEGESKAHTYSMLYAMKGLGVPFNKITANTTLYGVFKRDFGKTYVAYNPTEFEITVRFSDGQKMQVSPKMLAILR